ncbi:MAG: NAD(+) kinase [Gammaproteobacteria bacterium]|nr:MAG: NAD(+) kinase [Gammaproteobacteria bacterium]
MSCTFNKIGLIGKHSDPDVGDTLRELGEYLQEHQCEVLLEDSTAKACGDQGLKTVPIGTIGAQCDLAIIVGGDGTMLNSARKLSEFNVPLVGINQGRLGFLADISPAALKETLDPILAGDYIEESRSILHASFICENGMETESDAFNEVAIHKWNVARMIELDTYIDDQYVNTQRSDGLIVSSPTGSTAYALSGGGPLVHPSLNSVILVPICPHTMSHRPLVVGGDSTIEIVISEKNTEDAQVTCDGQFNFNLIPGDRVIIKNKPNPVRLIHPQGYDYYSVLRAKLHWSRKLAT